MSTRAIYTFCDSRTEVHVYKHHDGYPYCKFDGGEAGGLVWINDAKKSAWHLPRFEADEFAASFVAAHKSVGGGVRLIGDQKPWEYASDCAYWYKVACVDGDLHVTVLSLCGLEMNRANSPLWRVRWMNYSQRNAPERRWRDA